MSRFTLLVLILGLMKNGIECGTLGKNPKTGASLLPRAEGELPNYWRRLNLEFSVGNKFLANATKRIERSANATTKRQAKFLPKFSILAGLDIGGGLAPKATSNLSTLAKISQANSSPGLVNPYFAASYDPFPASAVHQSIQTLYNIVENLRQQVERIDKHTSNSTHSLSSAEDSNENTVDERNRHKQKLKTKKSAPKKKKQQKIRDEDEEIEDETDYVDEKPAKKNRVKTNTHARQQAQPITTTMIPIIQNPVPDTNTTITNSTEGNYTYNRPGWYYGGNPQSIDNLGFTYDRPQQSYGAPAFNYGPPSTGYGAPSYSYGAPSYSHGAPSQTYGSPSFSYGPPSRGYSAPYELAHYSTFRDSEPVVFDDLSENLFIPGASQRWQQRLPFARSQKLDSSTSTPIIAENNGFVPI